MNDELMELWQQGTSREPDPREVARLAARATTTRFDRGVFRRNLREYAGGALLMGIYGWQAVRGNHAVQYSIGFAAVGFVMIWLWWKHRGIQPLDPSADARTYRAAMLLRIDQQIRLLRTVRYWYLAPLFIPVFLQMAQLFGKGRRMTAILGLAGSAAVFWLAALLNEKLALPGLVAQRKRIESLYDE
jgi:hypothetical protein